MEELFEKSLLDVIRPFTRTIYNMAKLMAGEAGQISETGKILVKENHLKAIRCSETVK